MKLALGVALSILFVACGGGGDKKTPVKPKPEPIDDPPPKPVAKPVCMKGGDAMAQIGGATGGDDGAEFCVSDGADLNECFAVELASGKYTKLETPPTPQAVALRPTEVKVDATPTDVKVCKGDDCKTIKPKVGKNENQLVAVANETTAVVMIGDADSGKGVAEVWDVAKVKKTATIKYANGDFKCGVPKMLGATIFISASVCAGPAARGVLYNAKGKKIADAGGKEFGTYSESVVQVEGNVWAFLEENGSLVALQDVSTGKVQKTVDLGPLWRGDDAPAEKGDAPTMGNPGETALVRGGAGKLLAISGGPTPGSVGIIDVATGEMTIVRAPICK
jgi:hypothetical protein